MPDYKQSHVTAQDPPLPSVAPSDPSGSIRVVTIYGVAAAAWFGLTEGVFANLTGGISGLTKGLAFVAVSTLILAALLRRTMATETPRDRASSMARLARRLQAISEQASQAIYVKDECGRYLLFNSAAERMLNRTADDVIGRDDHVLFPADEAAELMEIDRKMMAERRIETYDRTLTTRLGVRTFSVTKAPLLDTSNRVVGIIGVSRDITELLMASEALRRSEARYRSMFENMLSGFASYEVIRENGRPVDFRYLFTNPSFEVQTGLKNVTGKLVSEMFPTIKETDAEIYEMGVRVAETGQPEKHEGYFSALNIWFVSSFFMTEDGLLAIIFENITERKTAEQKIEHLAYHDSLTGLPNRLLAQDRMTQAAAHAQRDRTMAALLFLDLDSFKGVNDSLGHSCGDDLIRAVAERLSNCVRDTDTISRHGGDEFLIVLTGPRTSDAISTTAGKILAQIAQPFDIQNQTLLTTASIGIAVYPGDGTDFATLLKKADTAMYHAKEEGRNTYRFFDERMNVGVAELLRMRNGLRNALDHDEFELHFQPQIDLASGRVIGAEALIRWNHPELGRVSPDRFIPVAEESGLIVPIGEWVLREACRRAAAWQKEGLAGVTVAVNLSALQFKRGNLKQTVTDALAEFGLDPTCLELELTESILIKDVEEVLATVFQLKSLGLKLAIDDFGTGYSSLSYLKRFKVDKLKIDKSFVRDLASDPDDAAIIRTIIQMAHSLNLRTIAEGVEDQEMLDRLRLFHCDEIQGYLIARPMPIDDFIAFVRAHSPSASDSASDRGTAIPILVR
ncbi:putative bifunctional diguanylate cyclase/phosphodiesterase [Magnetospirillum molischianum]|uniref:Putative Diguanylate cyclase n=1 Tax=Magnetospirillum molischianum DSM 120 TaxID=1150626 RepID=H8FTR7_MAGML|nr:EAL domain-containing protein [Magnetospirillum molischianum]CCG41774.1 putative Diguanylate cyclase [Magnetospirillum molischianum DSM 120]